MTWSALTEPDENLERTARWFEQRGPWEARLGDIIRRTFDEVLDGQRTGRYSVAQLSKVEKTYLGTKLEILLQSDLGLSRGKTMDLSVAGVDVDVKWSLSAGGWMIPTEAIGQLCLCVTADERTGLFSAGLIRADRDKLSSSTNKDSKRRFTPTALIDMTWLVRGGAIPESLLLSIDDTTRDALLDTRLSGQKRIDELFCRVQERIIRREVVLTVAQQHDPAKRVRDARLHLRHLDIAVLGHLSRDAEAARRFGLPVPSKGEWVSVTVADAEPGSAGAAIVDGSWRRRLFDPRNG
jgi:hypothetical protein